MDFEERKQRYKELCRDCGSFIETCLVCDNEDCEVCRMEHVRQATIREAYEWLKKEALPKEKYLVQAFKIEYRLED